MPDIDHTTALTLLVAEIRAQYNGLFNDISTRQVHPSYGVTKTRLWARLHQLEGLLYAYAAVADGSRSGAFDLQAMETAEHFGIDLTALRIGIKNS